MTHKIKPLGADRTVLLHCGREVLSRPSADLINRMKGATIDLEDAGLMTENSTAYIKPHGISNGLSCKVGKKPKSFIKIALSPGEDDDGLPLVAVRIEGPKLQELREAIARLDARKK